MAWPACSGEPGQIQAWKRANVPGPDEKCRDDAGGAEQIDHADVVVGSITWRPVRLLAGIDVSVALNTTTYQPAPLMPRQEYTSSGDQLQDAAALVTLEQIASLFL